MSTTSQLGAFICTLLSYLLQWRGFPLLLYDESTSQRSLLEDPLNLWEIVLSLNNIILSTILFKYYSSTIWKSNLEKVPLVKFKFKIHKAKSHIIPAYDIVVLLLGPRIAFLTKPKRCILNQKYPSNPGFWQEI